MLICGLSCPGDSDQQLAELGQNIDISTTQEKGDILFWKGHVAVCLSKKKLIHA